MGIDANFDMAFLKAQIAANQRLPASGSIFFSLNDASKVEGVAIARGFKELGFTVIATEGTANALEASDIEVERVLKLHEGRPHAGKRGGGEGVLVWVDVLAGSDQGCW